MDVCTDIELHKKQSFKVNFRHINIIIFYNKIMCIITQNTQLQSKSKFPKHSGWNNWELCFVGKERFEQCVKDNTCSCINTNFTARFNISQSVMGIILSTVEKSGLNIQ